MGRKTSRAIVLSICICLATLFMLITWFVYTMDRRPLFHQRYSLKDMPDILPTWTPTYPIADRTGAIGFVDTGINMFVVVVTDDKDIEIHCTKMEASPSEAVLLVGTPYEVRVHARGNTLMIVQDGAGLSFPLEHGMADEWHRDILALTSDRGWTLLGEIARRYQGERKAAIEEIRDSRDSDSGGGDGDSGDTNRD